MSGARDHRSPRRPTRAVVLAAGLGTRMRPLSHLVPKALMPLWGVPMLEHVLRLMKRWGVREVLVNLHHQSGQVLEYVRRRPPDGLRISLSFEPTILGTGGALRRAEWFLGPRPLWVVNADVAADLDPEPLVAALEARNLAALWLHPARGPRTVEVERGHVTSFRSRRPATPGTYTFCGLHLVRPEVLSFLPAGAGSIIEGYERAMAQGWHMAGVEVPNAYWADIGTPHRYLQAHEEVRQRLAHGAPGAALGFGLNRVAPDRAVSSGGEGNWAAVGREVEVARGAKLRASVVWDGARIGPRARLEHAVVAGGVRVDGPASGLVAPATAVLSTTEAAALQGLGWRPERVSAECLPPRGSDRDFIRVVQGRRSAMLVRYSPERRENALYARHARLLEGIGVRVPRVLLDCPRAHFTIFEDLGRVTLERLAAAGMTPGRQERLYRQVLAMVHRLHDLGRAEVRTRRCRLMPSFSPALYRDERALFGRRFLQGFHGQSRRAVEPVLAELEAVAERLRSAPPVLLHRDLQSSNILVRGSDPALIDFQGMRLGPAAYDLASLLFDPYVTLSAPLRDRLLAFYAGFGPDAKAAAGLVWWAAVQRLVQALGAYGKLVRLPGGDRYARHMDTAIGSLREVLPRLGHPFPRFRACLHGVSEAR